MGRRFGELDRRIDQANDFVEKTLIREKLTVSYKKEGDEEMQDFDLKDFMMIKFEEMNPLMKKKLAPISK